MHAARLRRGEDIARVRAEGASRNDRLFSLRSLHHDDPAVRVAVPSSRAVGGATKRNRARRRVREALRTALLAPPDPRTDLDLLVIVLPPALALPPPDRRSPSH